MSGLGTMAAKCAASVKTTTIVSMSMGVGVILYASHGFTFEVIGEIAGWINIVAYLPYFVSIAKGETRPSRSTWWIWSALEAMMSVSYIMSGAESTKWLPIASFVGMLLTAILSLRYGKKEWNIIDTVCSVGSVIGVCVWYFSGIAIVALLAFLIVDMLAAIPTIKKSWACPNEEDSFAWIITLVSGLINLLAIDSWSFAIAILPLYNVVIYAVVVFVLIKRS